MRAQSEHGARALGQNRRTTRVQVIQVRGQLAAALSGRVAQGMQRYRVSRCQREAYKQVKRAHRWRDAWRCAHGQICRRVKGGRGEVDPDEVSSA